MAFMGNMTFIFFIGKRNHYGLYGAAQLQNKRNQDWMEGMTRAMIDLTMRMTCNTAVPSEDF